MSAEDATTQCVPAVLKTARILDLVALGQRTEPGAPFLIRGEPGVGKDVLARLIHAASERQRYSFIKVNCAVRPAGRCEADLFGHDKGASPLAIRRRVGRSEEHTSELQSPYDLVCRLLLEKKKENDSRHQT